MIATLVTGHRHEAQIPIPLITNTRICAAKESETGMRFSHRQPRRASPWTDAYSTSGSANALADECADPQPHAPRTYSHATPGHIPLGRDGLWLRVSAITTAASTAHCDGGPGDHRRQLLPRKTRKRPQDSPWAQGVFVLVCVCVYVGAYVCLDVLLQCALACACACVLCVSVRVETG